MRQSIVRGEYRDAQGVGKAGGEMMRDTGIKGVAAAVEMKQRDVTVANRRHEPVATRLTLVCRPNIDIGKSLKQPIDAIEIGSAFRDIAAQTKSVVKLGADIQRSIFHEERPFCHERLTQHPSGQNSDRDPPGNRHAAQLV